MALASGVGDLVQDGGKLARFPVAEIDAQGIEYVAENAGHCEQQNPATRERDAGRSKLALHIGAQRIAGSVAVVAVVDRKKVEAIVGEEPQPASQAVELVQIDEQPIGTIPQLVTPRFQTAVPHMAHIE